MKKYLFFTVCVLSVALALAKLIGMGITIFEDDSSKEFFWYFKQLLYSFAFLSLANYMYKLAKNNGLASDSQKTGPQ